MIDTDAYRKMVAIKGEDLNPIEVESWISELCGEIESLTPDAQRYRTLKTNRCDVFDGATWEKLRHIPSFEFEATIDALPEKRQSGRTDTERLDFLLARPCRMPIHTTRGFIVQEWIGYTSGRGSTPREAIDDAISTHEKARTAETKG